MPQGLLVRNIPSPCIPAGAEPKPRPFQAALWHPRRRLHRPVPRGFSYNRGLETAVQPWRASKDRGIHLVFMGYGPLQILVDDAASASRACARSSRRSVRGGAGPHPECGRGTWFRSSPPACPICTACPTSCSSTSLLGCRSCPMTCRIAGPSSSLSRWEAPLTQDDAAGWRRLLNSKARARPNFKLD